MSPVATPTKFRASPSSSSSSISTPSIYSRECSRLRSKLQEERLRLGVQLDDMLKEWELEMDRLEKALGDQGLVTLLDHLAKINPQQERELRAYADELSGVLATAKVLRHLHQPVKVIQNWDALSRDVLDALKSRQTSANVLTVRKQAFSYYVWSAFSLGRAAAFSCYLANVAGAAIPSLVLAGAIVVPAALHTMIMVRDQYRLDEIYYKNRGAAFENIGRALRGLEEFPAHSVDDALAMLAFRDAYNKLPEHSPAAALDAKRAHYARMRDQYVMPINVLASCLGQILTMIQAPQWSSSLLLNLSSVAYGGQSLLDGRQGRAEYDKASGLSERYSTWLERKADCDKMRQWAGRNDNNRAARVGMTAHYRRLRAEQEPEQWGAKARLAKSAGNAVNAILAGAAGTLPWFKLGPPRLATIAGVVASSMSAVYMAATATKVLLRGDVREHAKERQRQARFTLALNDLKDLQELINQYEGKPQGTGIALMVPVPSGAYNERTGFAVDHIAVRPWENEYIALGALADAVDCFSTDDSGGDDPLADLLSEVWGMNPLDWVNLLRVLSGMRNKADRIAFIKQRLAGVVKVDFSLDPDGMETALPAEVVVHRFLLGLVGDDIDLKAIFSGSTDADSEAQWGPVLRARLQRELDDFGEDVFLAAMEQVWSGRIESKQETAERLRLFALHRLSEHLLAERRQFSNRLRANLEGTDKFTLIRIHRYSETDVGAFIDLVVQLLRAAPAVREKRRELLFHLARMKLTQDLLLKPERFTTLPSYKLACYQDLLRALGLVDRVVDPREYANQELVSSVDGSSTPESHPADEVAQNGDPPLQQGEVAADSDPQTEPQSPGAKLFDLIRKPSSKRKSGRSSAVLKAVVTQLPLTPAPVPHSNSARPLYTPVQPPETPLATPRAKPVSTPATTPQVESLRHRTSHFHPSQPREEAEEV